MATEIYYENRYNVSITEQQLVSMDVFKKITTVDGIIKKIESYKNNIITGIEYYLDDGEDETTVLGGLVILVSNSVSIIERETYLNYRIERIKVFFNSSLKFKSNLLFDSNNNLVCEEEIDISTDQPIYNQTEKTLYDSNNEKILGFDYNADGSIEKIWGIMVEDRLIYKDLGSVWPEQSLSAEKIDDYFPTLLSNNPYYSDATFLPAAIV
ncbi:MAG: hypothetical protein JXR34_05100 [Bacteroidales bacterium]|nr:hypothetical protein [Bacteroidales bacterium]